MDKPYIEKLEKACSPLVFQLRDLLAQVPTTTLLSSYQQKMYTATAHDDVPDGFWAKTRYLWALCLSTPEPHGTADADPKEIARLLDEIYEIYPISAVFEKGNDPRSEKEFLARMAITIQTRECGELGFPEQHKDWACRRFAKFDSSFFQKEYGAPFSAIQDWLSQNLSGLELCLNMYVEDLRNADSAVRASLRGKRVKKPRDLAHLLKRSRTVFRAYEAFNKATEALLNLNILHKEDTLCFIESGTVQKIFERFSVRRGGKDFAAYLYPHQGNPLETKLFVQLEGADFFFIDPSSAHRVLANGFEAQLLSDANLRTSYLRNRNLEIEDLTKQSLGQVFGSDAVLSNYYLEKGTLERDVLVRWDRTLLLFECKNGAIRSFKGATSDLSHYADDFKRTVQAAYEQAAITKKKLMEQNRTSFFDGNKRTVFEIDRSEFDEVLIVCVSLLPRGPLGFDLSLFLRKDDGEPFPWSVNIFDLQSITRRLRTPEKLIAYITARQKLHGSARTGDELNFAGYFDRYGHLDVLPGTMIDDSFSSSTFDHDWRVRHGLAEGEADFDPEPAQVSMERRGNRLIATNLKTGEVIDEIVIPDETMQVIEGRLRGN